MVTVHSKLKHEHVISSTMLVNSGFLGHECYINGSKVHGFCSVDVEAKAIHIQDESAYILHGEFETVTIRPEKFKLVHPKTNTLIMEWGYDTQTKQ